MTKSMKLRLIAKAIGLIGGISCLFGCLGYVLLTLPGVMNLPFELSYVLIVAAVMVAIAVACIVLCVKAKAIERAEDLAEEEGETGPKIPECCLTCPFADQCDELCVDAMVPAAAPVEEAESSEEEAVPAIKYPAVIEKARQKLPEEKREKVDQVAAKVQKGAKVAATAAAVCGAAVLTATACEVAFKVKKKF